MNRVSRERERSEAPALRRGIRFPVLVVLVSLVALAVVPTMVQWRVGVLRHDITEVADPATEQLAHVSLQLSVEAAARRGFLLSGDTVSVQRARSAREARRVAQDSARRLMGLLDPAAGAAMRELDRQLLAADAEVDSLFAAEGAERAYGAGVAARERRTDAARVTVDRLFRHVRNATAQRRVAIQRAERSGLAASIVLALAALAGAAAVVRIARRYRRLVLQLDDALAEAEHARDAAEERQRAIERVTASRARLIRGFTHDVKNPLGAADGYLALLADGVMGDLAEPQRETLGRVRRSIGTAIQLIGQLLDLARAEAGQLELRRVPAQVDAIAREMVDEYRAQAVAKQQTLEVRVDAELPSIMSDPLRVGQIIANLISNAVKYTPAHGTIGVHVGHRPDAVCVVVEDDGPGIPAERLPLLFHEFTRFDPDAAQGAGIGLAISEKIARMLGGQITVDSVVGRGSRFTLELPCEAPERRAATPEDRRRVRTTSGR